MTMYIFALWGLLSALIVVKAPFAGFVALCMPRGGGGDPF